jgi:hypothetical protein
MQQQSSGVPSPPARRAAPRTAGKEEETEVVHTPADGEVTLAFLDRLMILCTLLVVLALLLYLVAMRTPDRSH